MPILVKLDEVLHARRMTLTQLADRIGLTLANLSILKTGKARAVRFSTLEAICEALQCQPGDLLEYAASPAADEASAPTPATAPARARLARELKPFQRRHDPHGRCIAVPSVRPAGRVSADCGGARLDDMAASSQPLTGVAADEQRRLQPARRRVCPGRRGNPLSVADAASPALRACLERASG